MPIVLPKQKTEPKISVSDLTILIYGQPKIGKSTFCAGAESAVFLATEPGLNSLSVFQLPIQTWDEMVEAVVLLTTTKHEFKTVVIDTIAEAYRICGEDVCRKAGVATLADVKYGKLYGIVNAEISKVIRRLASSSMGLMMTAHSKSTEVTVGDVQHTKIVPNLNDKLRASVLGMVDCIFYADIDFYMQPQPQQQPQADGGPEAQQPRRMARRVVRTKPSASYEAGDRTGRFPETMLLDFSEVSKHCK